MNFKTLIFLSFSVVFSSVCFGQRYEKMKICDLKSNQKVEKYYYLDDLYSLDSTMAHILFYVEEGNNYRVWHDDKELGLFPQQLDFIPKLDTNSNLFLPIRKDEKLFLEINKELFGPFKKIRDAVSLNGNSLIGALTEDSFAWYYNGKKIANTSLISAGYIDPSGNYYVLSMERESDKLYLNGKLVEEDIDIFQPFFFNEFGSIVYFQKKNSETLFYYYLNGKRYGPIDKRRFAWFNKESGKFQALHRKDGFWIPEYDGKKKPPISDKDYFNLKLYVTGENLMVSYKKKADSDEVYFQLEEEYGPFKKLDCSSAHKGGTYYYLEDGIHKLGFKGKEIGRAEASIKKSHKNGEYFIYSDREENVYLNGKKLTNAPLPYAIVYINKSGRYFYDYYELETFERGLVDNGKKIPYSFDKHNLEIFNKDYTHYAMFNHSSDGEDFIIIDGKKFPFNTNESKAIYNSISDSFHWLTIDEKEVFWHSYFLDE